MLVVLAALIFAVSGLFAMLGMGGGMLHVPLLIWFGYPLKTIAQPVGILLNGLTTIIALATYSRKRLVDWRGGWLMALAALISAPLGSIVAHRVSSQLLILLLVAMIFFAAGRTLLTARQAEPQHIDPSRVRRISSRQPDISKGCLCLYDTRQRTGNHHD